MMGKALNLECGGWIRADYGEPGQQDEVQGEVCETLALDELSTPVPVYAIRGLLRRWPGVPRRGARPLSRFVGRTPELTLLYERLEEARRDDLRTGRLGSSYVTNLRQLSAVSLLAGRVDEAW